MRATSSEGGGNPIRRACLLLSLVTFLVLPAGCRSFQPVRISPDGVQDLAGETVRVTYPDRTRWILKVQSIDFPVLLGFRKGKLDQVDLNELVGLEVSRFDLARTLGLSGCTGGVVVGLAGGIAIGLIAVMTGLSPF